MLTTEMSNVLLGLVAGVLGVLLSAWHNAVKASRGEFDFTIWVTENSNGIALSFAGIILGVTITAVIPGVTHLSPEIQLPSPGNALAWFLTGIALYSRTRKLNRKSK